MSWCLCGWLSLWLRLRCRSLWLSWLARLRLRLRSRLRLPECSLLHLLGLLCLCLLHCHLLRCLSCLLHCLLRHSQLLSNSCRLCPHLLRQGSLLHGSLLHLHRSLGIRLLQGGCLLLQGLRLLHGSLLLLRYSLLLSCKLLHSLGCCGMLLCDVL